MKNRDWLARKSFAIDFAHYKPTMVARRIERRLLFNQAIDFPSYIRLLESDPGELSSLYRDLLIGVTRFFRDPAAFERLERDILPGLIAELPDDQEMRVWVAGCATGEGVRWDAVQLLVSSNFRCSGADAVKVGFSGSTTVVMIADFYRAGDGNEESFRAPMIVSEFDIAPDVDGMQNLWVQGVGCGAAVVNFNRGAL